MKKLYLCKLCLIVFGAVLAVQSFSAEPIYHEVFYPKSNGPVPAVVLLHTSGGFKTVKGQIRKYTSAGYAVYVPDFFKRHGITKSNRFETW
ncbi:MAG: dienelactone hydrolase family protein, partial [Betaproteobacteria bacterium]